MFYRFFFSLLEDNDVAATVYFLWNNNQKCFLRVFYRYYFLNKSKEAVSAQKKTKNKNKNCFQFTSY